MILKYDRVHIRFFLIIFTSRPLFGGVPPPEPLRPSPGSPGGPGRPGPEGSAPRGPSLSNRRIGTLIDGWSAPYGKQLPKSDPKKPPFCPPGAELNEYWYLCTKKWHRGFRHDFNSLCATERGQNRGWPEGVIWVIFSLFFTTFTIFITLNCITLIMIYFYFINLYFLILYFNYSLCRRAGYSEGKARKGGAPKKLKTGTCLGGRARGPSWGAPWCNWRP